MISLLLFACITVNTVNYGHLLSGAFLGVRALPWRWSSPRMSRASAQLMGSIGCPLGQLINHQSPAGTVRHSYTSPALVQEGQCQTNVINFPLQINWRPEVKPSWSRRYTAANDHPRGRVIHAVILRACCLPPCKLKSLPLGLKARGGCRPPAMDYLPWRAPVRHKPGRALVGSSFLQGKFQPFTWWLCRRAAQGRLQLCAGGAPGGAEH